MVLILLRKCLLSSAVLHACKCYLLTVCMLNRLKIKKILYLSVAIVIATAAITAAFAGYDYYQQKRYEFRVARAIIKPVKVFQIGFSKCGTSTISSFFNRNGVPSVHHDFGHLATSIYENARDGMPLISPNYEHYAVFTDMERMYGDPPISIGMLYFKELDKQYPGSKFILNTRDKQAWLKSRSKHPIGKHDKTTLLKRNSAVLKLSQDAVLAKWSKEWDEHHRAVKEYFKDRPNDLLVFDIEQDSPEKLTNFLQDYFVLDPKFYKHVNKTSEREAKADEEDQVVEVFHKTYKIDPKIREQHKQLLARALIKPVKVFQIGFSKCGTSTLSHFFYVNGVASVHHDFGKLAMSMYHNSREGKPLINPEYEEFYVYTDMERMYGDPPINIGMLMFKELDKQYPGSKFILNIRDKQAWLRSRSTHPMNRTKPLTILEVNQRILHKTKEEVLAQWSKEWDEHHRAVKEYFKHRPNDLLVFNIETDPPEKLAEFFKDNFYLDPKLYEHMNKTSEREQKILAGLNG